MNILQVPNHISSEDMNTFLAHITLIKPHLAQLSPNEIDNIQQVYALLTEWRLNAHGFLGYLHYRFDIGDMYKDKLSEDSLKTAKNVLYLQKVANQEFNQLHEWHSILQSFYRYAIKDLNSVLICIAEQLIHSHSIEPVQGTHYSDDAYSWAYKIENIYLPVLEFLGMWKIREELGDSSLKISNPGLFKALIGISEDYYQDRKERYDYIKSRFKQELAKRQINASVEIERRCPSRLYRQLITRRIRKHQLDIFQTINVVIADDDEAVCYHATAILHELIPKPNWFSPTNDSDIKYSSNRHVDNIDKPLYNGYRADIWCFHEGRAGSNRYIEFRCFTELMNRVNKMGIIADRYWFPDSRIATGAWWNLDELYSTLSDYPRQIYAFTPAGKPYKLPSDSTPIDFAARVHSELLFEASSFYVNGKQVDEQQYRLQHFDVVFVKKGGIPTITTLENWIDNLTSTNARTKAKSILKRKFGITDLIIHEIRKRWQEEMNFNHRFDTNESFRTSLSLLMDQLNCDSPAAVANRILDLDDPIDIDTVVFGLINILFTKDIVIKNDKLRKPRKIRIADCCLRTTRLDDQGNSLRAIPPRSEIVGLLREHSLVVHRKGCSSLRHSSKTISLDWYPSREIIGNLYEFRITAFDRSRILLDLLNEVYKFYTGDREVYLHEVHASLNDVTNDEAEVPIAEISFTMETKSPSHANNILAKLREYEQTDTVKSVAVWTALLEQNESISMRLTDRIYNPYGPEVLRDSTLFYGRSNEIKRIDKYFLDGYSFAVLVGHQNIGKSSLLHYFKNEHKKILHLGGHVEPIYFELKSTNVNATTLCHQIYEETYKSLFSIKRDRKTYHLAKSNFELDPFSCLEEWFNRVLSNYPSTKLLLLIDELTHLEELHLCGQLDPGLVLGLRGFLTSNPRLKAILAIHENVYLDNAYVKNTKTILDSLLSKALIVRLGTLDELEARRLIVQPVGDILQYDDNAVDYIVELTGCHPYYLQMLCRQIVEETSAKHDPHISAEFVQNQVLPRVISDGWDLLGTGSIIKEDILYEKIIVMIANRTTMDKPSLSFKQLAANLTDYSKESIGLALGYLKSQGILVNETVDENEKFRFIAGLYRNLLRWQYPLEKEA